jgi:glycosyltransferase involved in cell wall biosynthesis
MSLAVLEAMACGLPVVASNLEGNAEIIDNGETGYLVPPADSRALAEAISLLLDNHKIASQIGNNARKKTEEFYDWERVTDQTLKIYLALVEDVK